VKTVKISRPRGTVFFTQTLEEGVDNASESGEDEKFIDEEEETDGGRLDENFDQFSTHLRRRMILLASQSVDERFKKFTAHRWKMLKGY